jgi:hypothetical protein
MLDALDAIPDLHVLVQPGRLDPLVSLLLDRTRHSDRVHTERRWIPSFAEIHSSLSALDIGMAVYLHDGPQFRNMGTSSTKLNMFLTMGVPVVASRQPSFHFLENYGCGVLAASSAEFVEGIRRIREKRGEMSKAALRAGREYVDSPRKYLMLKSEVARVIGDSGAVP